ncbi:hypothetical protein HK097_006701, partial [Rhizophlyctis rosea]
MGLGFLSSVKVETRVSVAHIIAIVASSDLDKEDRAAVFRNLLEERIAVVKDKSKQISLEARHGSTVALGFLIGRLRYRYPQAYASFVPEDLLQKATATIAEELNESSSITLLGVCQALAEAGRYAPLSLPKGDAAAMEVDSGAGAAESRAWTIESVIQKLISLVRLSKDPKVQEKAITTLGHLTVGDKSLVDKVLTFFYTLPSTLTKQIEIHFTIGDAVSAVGCGWGSANMERYLDV